MSQEILEFSDNCWYLLLVRFFDESNKFSYKSQFDSISKFLKKQPVEISCFQKIRNPMGGFAQAD